MPAMKLIPAFRKPLDPGAERRKRAQRLARKGVAAKPGKTLRARYEGVCYEFIGQRLDDKPRTHLNDRLKQANMNMSAGMFLSLATVSALLAAIGGLVGSLLYFALVVNTVWWPALAVAFGVAIGAMAGGAFPYVLQARIGKRREKIERELPFSLSELSVLASIGLSPVAIFHRMAKREHDPVMTAEFRKVVFKAQIQGKDLITALAEAARESPSRTLRDTLWDLGNMIHQGSNLATYLTARANEVLEMKRAKQTRFIETLGTFGDMYVTGVLLSVIFLGMGAFLVDAFGVGAIDGPTLVAGLAYFLMPMIIIVVAILLSTAHARVD